MSGSPKTRRSPRGSPKGSPKGSRSPRSPNRPPSNNYVKYPEDYNEEESNLFVWRKVELRKAQREGRQLEPLYYKISDFRETSFATPWVNVDEQIELTALRKRDEQPTRDMRGFVESSDPGKIHRDEVNGIFLAPAYKAMLMKRRAEMGLPTERKASRSDEDIEGAAY